MSKGTRQKNSVENWKVWGQTLVWNFPHFFFYGFPYSQFKCEKEYYNLFHISGVCFISCQCHTLSRCAFKMVLFKIV